MNNSTKQAYSVEYDLSNCEKEPIHLIRLVQAHACLIACHKKNFKILQISDNSDDFFGYAPTDLLGKDVQNLFSKTTIDLIKQGLNQADEFKSINPIRVNISKRNKEIFHHLIAHVNKDDILILEIEPIQQEINTIAYQVTLSEAIYKIQKAAYDQLFDVVAKEFKQFTQYDRVMVYRFDEAYNGTVIAEAKEDFVEPYLGLTYPASDIPPQARALFLKNRVRILVDTDQEPAQTVPLLPTGHSLPLDLTQSVTRGLSPIHLEYLSNMGVKATLSIAIILEGQLWGLIACHHYSPKFLDFTARTSCQFLGQFFSGHLAITAANQYRISILKSNLIRVRLFEKMSEDYNILEGLTNQTETILDLVDCTGAAIITDAHIVTMGKTPTKKEIKKLVEWLDERTNQPVFHTNELSSKYPPSIEYKDVASGLLAIKFALNPNEFVLWFKPEKVQEVIWGGDPNKAMEKTNGRISPRKSFAKWKELIQNIAEPWQKFELDAAVALRNDIKESILRKFNEVKELNKKMKAAYEELETFSYSVSHDLRSPIRNIDGLVQILKEDYTDQLDESGIEIINSIIESTDRMSLLIKGILDFSRLGKIALNHKEINTKELVEEVLQELNPLNKKVAIKIASTLHNLYGDKTLIRQMLVNLLSNAIKYSQNKPQPKVTIITRQEHNYTTIKISDNGIGFDMKYEAKIFGVFHRLVGESEYEGTGIGLAIVHRIIEKHNGIISVDSKINQGSAFIIALPNKSK